MLFSTFSEAVCGGFELSLTPPPISRLPEVLGVAQTESSTVLMKVEPPERLMDADAQRQRHSDPYRLVFITDSC